MKRLLRIALRVALVLGLLAATLALWKREEITRLMAVNTLFAPDKITANFSHMDKLFLTRNLSRGDGPVTPLPAGPPLALPPAVAEWVLARNVTALVVLRHGKLVHESYHHGTARTDLRISWSMAKSFLSALFGTVLAEGKIGSIDDQVTKYVPELIGSAYDGVSIRHLLNMTTGVAFNEDYQDFNSDINRMGRTLALGGSMDAFAASLKTRDVAPGSKWRYVSIDTHVLGMVIKGATGRDPADLMEARIIQPMGLEAAPFYLTDGDGTAFVLGGLNLISRDYARFGQMILQEGRWQGRQIVPADWIAAATAASAPGGAEYGYQWWTIAGGHGDFMSQGIYGQYMYISPRYDTVIVVSASDRGFEDTGVGDGNITMLQTIAAAY
jgi:CubicO group peptidase (beta-lactamase class C family)